MLIRCTEVLKKIVIFLFFFIECGSAINNSSGTIQNPGFPKDMEYSDCIWDIDPGDRNKSVLLSFSDFDIPLSFKCKYVTV